jgi:hypothetical protein
MYFRYILHVYQNTNVPYIQHEMHSFVSVFMCFYCVFTAETISFGTFHMLTKIHMYHIFYMKDTVLLVFSCVFTVFLLQKHVIFCTFHMYIPKYTLPYILHEMHSFASVFMCFHCVFTAETCGFCVFTCIPKYTCTIYST